MLNHSPINKWQHGLLKLYGVIDGSFFNILWFLAANCDDKGRTDVRDDHIEWAVVKEEINVRRDIRRLKDVGLIKVIRPMRKTYSTETQRFIEVDRRVIAIYSGIQHGRVPKSGLYVKGAVPYQFQKHGRGKCTTHHLVREKFKPKKNPTTKK